MSDAILVIDEGTSSTRAVLVEADGRFNDVAQYPLTTSFPEPGCVEQDATEIWELTLKAMREAMRGNEARIRAIGITNQRETIVAWDARTGLPLAPAIVWQDRRTAAFCDELKARYPERSLQEATGLLFDPYFSGTKIAWLLRHCPAVAEAGPHLRVGTIDSWLIWKLSSQHVTDATNAARTLLMDLRGGWIAPMADLLGVPLTSLPRITDSAGPIAFADPSLFGRPLPITGVAGDQQAAAIGQACLAPGQTKATYGTGAFVLTHLGAPAHLPVSTHRLLCTVAWQIDGQRAYALEGSLFVAGQMIQWLRDDLGLIASSSETAALAQSVRGSDGVAIVPAFAGLGAPHWNPETRGAIVGLTLGTNRAHLVRAALEAVANQTAELQRAFAGDGSAWTSLKIDGGMSANDFLAQDLADLLDLPVERPDNVESTVLGAAMLTAVGSRLYPDLDAAAASMRGPHRHFTPSMDAQTRSHRLAQWDKAVTAVIGMVE